MVPLCSVSWIRNGSPLEGNCWAFHSCSLEVQLVTLSAVCTSDHFNPCTSNDETRNTSNSSEVDHHAVNLSVTLLPVCAPCRWGWSSWREVSSGGPCWEVVGPRWFPEDSLWSSGSHPLIQCPLSQWPSEEGAHPVVEAELQGMVQPHTRALHFLSDSTVWFGD